MRIPNHNVWIHIHKTKNLKFRQLASRCGVPLGQLQAWYDGHNRDVMITTTLRRWVNRILNGASFEIMTEVPRIRMTKDSCRRYCKSCRRIICNSKRTFDFGEHGHCRRRCNLDPRTPDFSAIYRRICPCTHTAGKNEVADAGQLVSNVGVSVLRRERWACSHLQQVMIRATTRRS
jgi:hypothetical protein